MRTAAFLVLALLLCACGSFSPVPITAGDKCASCGKAIESVQVAAEAITTQGSVLKFRTVECLARHMRDNAASVGAKFVTDYRSGRLVRPESATFVRAVINENTLEKGYFAFTDVNQAVEFGKKNMSSPIDWLMIQRLTADRDRKSD